MSPQSKSRSSRPAGAGFVFEKLRNNAAAHKNTPDASAQMSSILLNAGPYGRVTADSYIGASDASQMSGCGKLGFYGDSLLFQEGAL
jgi:hypothetical protein